MKDTISIVLSVLALGLSSVTAWLTLLRTGTIRMTRPTVVFFGPDGGSGPNGESRPKVFLRTLLFSTSQRGRIVESMYITLRRGETRQTFSIWVYGDKQLMRGSGLHVGHTGVVCNHHFLLPDDGTGYRFLLGSYTVEVYASLVGEKKPRQLSKFVLVVSEAVGGQLQAPDAGVYFDWGPDSNTYHPHVEVRSEPPIPPMLVAFPHGLATERLAKGKTV
ncbi:MAG TPA: hypothetical protein VGM50_18160 [Gemmatimonadaceae bacterium]